ncbi:hypothetical protein AA15237_0899 [Komagataeibacter xylinus NBRC 15237]|nr:hypothetical protein AA15237_0899 [Komagataeibacter xylinus NBRC 15237]
MAPEAWAPMEIPAKAVAHIAGRKPMNTPEGQTEKGKQVAYRAPDNMNVLYVSIMRLHRENLGLPNTE